MGAEVRGDVKVDFPVGVDSEEEQAGASSHTQCIDSWTDCVRVVRECRFKSFNVS